MTVDTRTRPISAYAETRAAGDSEFTRRFVATTVGMKRDGLDIDLEGMTTDNFMRNPVFLWVHDYWGERLPIGLVKKIQMQKKRMVVTALFDEADEFAMEVLRKYDAGFLNAVSIGWETLEFDRETMRVVESDLLDVSAVPVPGDPDALMIRQRSLLRSLGTDLLEKFPEGDDPSTWEQYRDKQLEDPAFRKLYEEFLKERGTEPLEADFGEHGAKCIECGKPITDYYLTVIEEGREYGEVHCVPCGQAKISGESKETIDTQEGEQMAMERMERVVAALDELRSAWSDLIDSAGNEDDDESMATLLAAFTGDETNEGEED